jgi:hypothetical protein
MGATAAFLLPTAKRFFASSAAVRSESQEPVLAPHAQADLAITLAATRTALLEARVAALEGLPGKKPPEPAQAEDIAPTVQPDRTPPSAAEISQMHQAAIDQHRAERLDPRWAAATSAAFKTDFESKTDNTSFTLKEVDCRSTTCTLEFEWPSRELAATEWKKALMHRTKAPCARRIVVPEPVPGQTGPVRVSMLVDCSTWVAGGAQLAEQ